MPALHRLLGEQTLNHLLQIFLQAYAFPKQPTMKDFLPGFYLHSAAKIHAEIDELFRQIVLHDFNDHLLNS